MMMARSVMTTRRSFGHVAAGLSASSALTVEASATPAHAGRVLASWNDGAAQSAITDFVQAVTTAGSRDFVPVAARIAVFDNDSTLWCEVPTVQLMFAIDRVRQLLPQHPEWRTQQPFKAAIDNDMSALAATGQRGIVEILMTTHAGNTSEQFAVVVADWLATARHPKSGRPYTEMIYQPMLELLDFLRHHGFRTFVVSGGGVEFMRVWAEKVYGIPPEQVIGSTIKTRHQVSAGGTGELFRLPAVDFIDDGAGKSEAIGKFIRQRPIAAFGNSDGDLQMLQYTTRGSGSRLGLIVHHDDAKREVAYDRNSDIGRLAKALDMAGPAGWVVVSMKKDWHQIFPDHDGEQTDGSS
nr:HAD family hydrolase [Gluconacetobacter azotocaptans]